MEKQKTIKVYEIEFACGNKICTVALDVEEAMLKALEYAQEKMDKEKKECKKEKEGFDEQQFADEFIVDSVKLIVETDY